MASLFIRFPSEVKLLDPGPGLGSLTDAFVRRFSNQTRESATLEITAYEFDPALCEQLASHFDQLGARQNGADPSIKTSLYCRDFITEGCVLAGFGVRPFTHVILNPPYKKIGANSFYRKLLRRIGIETVNLYTAFLGLAVALTMDGGEIIAIIPRSFCNGTYFRPFREWLLDQVAIRHIHVFETRNRAFAEDAVLQENVIFLS